MRVASIALLLALLAATRAGAAVTATDVGESFGRGQEPSASDLQPRDVLWFDDVESGENGWTHGDWTAAGEPKFHLDTYMAWGGSGRSWWCGNFDYDADGGYGNNWFEFLEIPPVSMSSTGVPDAGRDDPAVPVLTFCFRHDAEPGYDFVFVRAESGGAYVDLDSFDGYAGWTDLGDYGYLIGAFDDPFRGRFLFASDGSVSDADGQYQSAGGGCAFDNIRVFDQYSGRLLFLDDGEGGGLCSPGHQEPAGDLWHIAHDMCSSYSRPHSWQCVDQADTTRLPPLMQNWLDSPWINLWGAYDARWHAKAHFEVAGYDGDYWYVWATFDGVTYYTLKANYGDMGSCTGWSTSYANGVNLCTLPGGPSWVTQVQISHAMYTDANATLPTAGGCCGIVFDDILFDRTSPCPVDHNSWGSVKALFR